MRRIISTLMLGVASVLPSAALAQTRDVDIAVVTMNEDDGERWLAKGISDRIVEIEKRIVSGGKSVKTIRVRPDDQYREFNKDEGLDLPTSVETVNGTVRVGREVTILSGFRGRYRMVDDRIEVSVRRTWIDKWRKKKGMRYPFVVNSISEGRTYALDAPNIVQMNRSSETIKGTMAIMYVAPSQSLDAAIARKGRVKANRVNASWHGTRPIAARQVDRIQKTKTGAGPTALASLDPVLSGMVTM